MNWFKADPLLRDAAKIIVDYENASASFLQRKMSNGYARAARLLDQLQYLGIISPADGASPREIYIKEEKEIDALLRPRKLTEDELQQKMFELDIKVNRILSSFRNLSITLADEEYESNTDEELVEKAKEMAKGKKGNLTVAEIQRKLNIGYARSARILDELRQKKKY